MNRSTSGHVAIKGIWPVQDEHLFTAGADWWLQRRYTPAWRPGQLDEVDEVDLEELLEQMKFALEMADRNARLIHPTPWQEAQVHPFPGPPERRLQIAKAFQQ